MILQLTNSQYQARLYDLPRNVEGYKTLDKKGYYKCSDIYQILVIARDRNDLPNTDIYPDGLTPPMEVFFIIFNIECC